MHNMAAFTALELHHDRCTIALAQRLMVAVGEHMTPGFVAFRPVTPAAQVCLVRSKMSTIKIQGVHSYEYVHDSHEGIRQERSGR